MGEREIGRGAAAAGNQPFTPATPSIAGFTEEQRRQAGETKQTPEILSGSTEVNPEQMAKVNTWIDRSYREGKWETPEGSDSCRKEGTRLWELPAIYQGRNATQYYSLKVTGITDQSNETPI